MGRGLPPSSAIPTQPSSHLPVRDQTVSQLRLGAGTWRVGKYLSHKGVLVINGPGMAPFFSVAP